MDRNSMLIAPAIFALTFSTSVFAQEPPVRVNVAHLQPAVAKEGEKHAALEGLQEAREGLEVDRIVVRGADVNMHVRPVH